ncbi:ribosomal RNA large subunit methyltransferase J [Dictyocaulus viviparus]|uniref:Mitochondrial import inner membrane translocase subunit tim-16 n=1 Tax=Dictyocaulus viviparus TaxID=29172 RepID=A0A0D8Y2U0_DICVI|nr:ribosomal RNA large subunit methyltransferase J [Dictyocaulus viviparus]
MGIERLENANPLVYTIKPRERANTEDSMNESVEDPIDALEIFDLIRDINDPEHPYTLEQLNVVQEELIKVRRDTKHTYVDIRINFTTYLSFVLMSFLKIRVSITEGSHNTEEAINRQLADKERVAAAMENTNLILGITVLDIGCAPGSWSQVVVERCGLNNRSTSGYLLSIDLQPVSPIPGADILSLSDITSPKTQELIAKKLNGRMVDVVLSDMCPNPTGDNATDHLRLTELCRAVFHLFARKYATSASDDIITKKPPLFRLSSDGKFLCKMWDGSYRQSFILELLKYFKHPFQFDCSPEILFSYPLIYFNASKMPWRHAVKVALAVGEAVAKALARAIRQEIQQSQQAAASYATKTGQSANEERDCANANVKYGISLEESLQILNVKPPIDQTLVEKNFEHLFSINDMAKGGSFYLQSKIYRAKERIDEELRRQGVKAESSSDKDP